MNIAPRMHQNRVSEAEYRTIKDRLSYSSIKIYNDSPLQFYEEFVLGKAVKREKSKDMIIGDAVDCLLFQGEDRFHELFEIDAVGELKKDQNQMNTFTYNLWDITLQAMDEEGIITRDFQLLAEDAYNATKYDFNGQEIAFKRNTLEQVIEKFFGSNCEIWYNQKRKTLHKTMLSLADLDAVEKIINALKTTPDVQDIINQENTEEIEVFNQFSILFEIQGIPVKCLLDKLVINHKTKQIIPYDLKCTWEIFSFEKKYLEYKYYIQNAVYTAGLEFLKKEHFPDYEIVPFSFIVAHSTNKYKPMIYKTDQTDYLKGNLGFWCGAKYYKGVSQLLTEIKWRLDNSSWDSSPTGKQIANLMINYR